MIIPMVCFTCGRPIAHLWLKYFEIVKNYEFKLKNPSKQPLTEEEQTHKPEYLALRDLQIGNMCCRRMFLSQHDMYEKVR